MTIRLKHTEWDTGETKQAIQQVLPKLSAQLWTPCLIPHAYLALWGIEELPTQCSPFANLPLS